MKATVEIIARGVWIQRGQLLVCHTRGARNTYLPGGHVEFGECARESLRREIVEELGIAPRIGRFLGAVEHAFRQHGRKHCEVNLVFAVALSRLQPPAAPAAREDHLDFRWLALKDLPHSNLEPRPLRRFLRTRGRSAFWAGTI